MHRLLFLSLLQFLFWGGELSAQVSANPNTSTQAPNGASSQTGRVADGPAHPPLATHLAKADYVLGGDDQLQVDIPALSNEYTSEKVFRIDGSGDLGLPVIGHVQAAGLTVAQLEERLKQELKRFVKEPDVIVSVVGFGSQPVSVLGSVRNPGIVQIAGSKRLFDVLSMAGGLATDAGYQVTITRELSRGPLPLPDARTDATGQYSVASVKFKDLFDSATTAYNIVILPNDKIVVPTSELVYAVGEVTKPGGFLLNQHESLSALQVVSLAQGFVKTAAPQRARILRVVDGSPNRMEIAVDLKALVGGKTADIQLQPQDILFVPNSAAKTAGYGAMGALGAAASALIYVGAR